MSLETWLAFVAASTALLVIPGPTVMLVITYALGEGRRSALATVAGVTLGDFAAMTASLLGLGALLAASALAFTALKWIGAAYLIWLGIRLWRAPATLHEGAAATAGRPAGTMAWHAFAVTALNPKSIVFFVAFLPQFMRADLPLLPQAAILEATFLALAALNALAYALVASGARRTVRRPGVLRWMNRLGGGVLVGAGLLTLAWRRAA